MNGGDGVERRRFIGALAASAGAGIAGCLGGNEPEDDGDDGRDRFEPTIANAPDAPFEFAADHRCAVCNMPATKYPEPGQIVHEDGRAAAFDSPGCLFAYVAWSASESPIAGAWTTDRATDDLIDATEAHFVIITDEEAVDDPMGIDPKAFAEREAAVSYLEAWDAEELTPDDDIVVGLEAIDLELASIYRPHHVPDE